MGRARDLEDLLHVGSKALANLNSKRARGQTRLRRAWVGPGRVLHKHLPVPTLVAAQ